jgi:hypothetical protein
VILIAEKFNNKNAFTIYMADIKDIEALVKRAQAMEGSDPHEAHARYEIAERKLDEHLIINFGVSRDILEKNPSHPLAKRFSQYYKNIMAGYERLNANKQA